VQLHVGGASKMNDDLPNTCRFSIRTRPQRHLGVDDGLHAGQLLAEIFGDAVDGLVDDPKIRTAAETAASG
jgi:hypothetical protein